MPVPVIFCRKPNSLGKRMRIGLQTTYNRFIQKLAGVRFKELFDVRAAGQLRAALRPGVAPWGPRAPRAAPRRIRAQNFPGGGRAGGAGFTARLLPSLGDEASPRRRGNARTGRANLEPPGRAGCAARTGPRRRGRAHPGVSPQAAIRQGRATGSARSTAASPVCQLAGTRGSAASGRTRRTQRGRGQAGVRAAAQIRPRTARGARTPNKAARPASRGR